MPAIPAPQMTIWAWLMAFLYSSGLCIVGKQLRQLGAGLGNVVAHGCRQRFKVAFVQRT